MICPSSETMTPEPVSATGWRRTKPKYWRMSSSRGSTAGFFSALMLTTEGMTASATRPSSSFSAVKPGMRAVPTAGLTLGRALSIAAEPSRDSPLWPLFQA